MKDPKLINLYKLIEELIDEAAKEGIHILVSGGKTDDTLRIQETTPGYWQHSWC